MKNGALVTFEFIEIFRNRSDTLLPNKIYFNFFGIPISNASLQKILLKFREKSKVTRAPQKLIISNKVKEKIACLFVYSLNASIKNHNQ
jgi:hypothetical protein